MTVSYESALNAEGHHLYQMNKLIERIETWAQDNFVGDLAPASINRGSMLLSWDSHGGIRCNNADLSPSIDTFTLRQIIPLLPKLLYQAKFNGKQRTDSLKHLCELMEDLETQ